MKTLQLLWPIFIVFACSSRKQQGLDSATGPTTSSVKVQGQTFALVSLPPTGTGYYVRVCNSQNSCTEDLISSSEYSPRGLAPGDYTASFFSCTNSDGSYSCKDKLGSVNFTQSAYTDANLQFYFQNLLNIQRQQAALGYVLFGLLNDQRNALKKCTGTLTLDPSSTYASYYNQLDGFLKQQPIAAVVGLSKLYADEANSLNTFIKSPSSPTQLGLAGEEFTYTAEKNIRVTLINHLFPASQKLEVFEGDSWTVDKIGVLSFLDPTSSGHASLLIERLNPSTGKFETFRYISWPSGDNLEDDLRSGYLNREVVRVELPPLAEADVMRFDSWYKAQPYSDTPGSKAGEYAEQRLKLKKSLAKEMGLPDDVIKGFSTSDPKNKKIIKDAVAKKYSIAAIDKEMEAIKLKTPLDEIRMSELVTQKADLEKELEGWFENWDAWKSWSGTKPVEAQANARKIFANYLQAEYDSDRIRDWKPGEREAATAAKKQNLDYMRDLLATPTGVDYEAKSFAFWRNWKLDYTELTFEKIHGFNPRLDADRWKDFVLQNHTSIQSAIQQLPEGTHVSPADKKFAAEAKAVDFQERFKSFDDYRKSFLSGAWDKYHAADLELNRKSEKYGKSFDERKNNCSCAAAKSLDVLYDKKIFTSKTDLIMTPGLLQRRAEAFAEEQRKGALAEPEAGGGAGKQLAFTAAAAGVMSSVAVVVDVEAFHLTGTKDDAALAICFQDAQNAFYDASEPVLERFQELYFGQKSVQYFISGGK